MKLYFDPEQKYKPIFTVEGKTHNSPDELIVSIRQQLTIASTLWEELSKVRLVDERTKTEAIAVEKQEVTSAIPGKRLCKACHKDPTLPELCNYVNCPFIYVPASETYPITNPQTPTDMDDEDLPALIQITS